MLVTYVYMASDDYEFDNIFNFTGITLTGVDKKSSNHPCNAKIKAAGGSICYKLLH